MVVEDVVGVVEVPGGEVVEDLVFGAGTVVGENELVPGFLLVVAVAAAVVLPLDLTSHFLSEFFVWYDRGITNQLLRFAAGHRPSIVPYSRCALVRSGMVRSRPKTSAVLV